MFSLKHPSTKEEGCTLLVAFIVSDCPHTNGSVCLLPFEVGNAIEPRLSEQQESFVGVNSMTRWIAPSGSSLPWR